MTIFEKAKAEEIAAAMNAQVPEFRREWLRRQIDEAVKAMKALPKWKRDAIRQEFEAR